MELREVLRRRRMVRSFDDRSLPDDVVDELVKDALRVPSAGNTNGTAWILLSGAERDLYWQHTTTAPWRQQSRRWPGLSRAPLIVLSLASPDHYLERYGEPDKRSSGLGHESAGGGGAAAWPVPYWFADAAFGVLALLLGATDRGLGGCFLGNFRGEEALLDALGVPRGWRLFGAVLLGHPDGADHRSPSLSRPPPSPAERVRRGRW